MSTSIVFQDKLFIDGDFVNPKLGKTFDVINPATEEIIAKAPAATKEDIDIAVAAAKKAFKTWRKTTGKERAVYLRKIAEKITEKKEMLAKIETLDNGKPLAESICDMDDSAYCFNYYADLADQLDSKQYTSVQVPDPRFTSRLVYEPVGVVAAIIPWNYPLMMAAWKLAPILAAGCTVVLKPSELTPLSSLELGVIAKEIGLPNGVLNIVLGFGNEAGEPLANHPDIDKIAFTGSVPTGSKLMGIAAKDIKNVTLELGGKSPLLIFSDSDLVQAVEWVMFGFTLNQGQVCSSTSRVIVQDSFKDKFLESLKTELSKLKIGDGLDSGVNLGPIVNESQYKKVLGYVKSGVDEGATLEYGGNRPKGLEKGYFIEPTVFSNVKPHHKIWKEEIFGPVLSVATFSTEEEAVELANDTTYGLAAGVISKDLSRCERIARELNAGIVWINTSQPAFVTCPWGGVKKSGIGRELGTFGLDIYLEVKQITAYTSDAPYGWYVKN